MYKKLNSLVELQKIGLNVHTYRVCKTAKELAESLAEFEYMCSIRTDSIEHSTDLPFLAIDRDISNVKELVVLMNKVQSSDLIAIVSNGRKYDEQLEYNMVYSIKENGDFRFEMSKENVPLRYMYKNPNQLKHGHGNINEPLRYSYMTYGINKYLMIDDLRHLWNYGVYHRNVEVTKYKTPCGDMRDNFVFWQIQHGRV